MRKVTTPVPVEGGVAGGALPMSAGTSFHGRRKPNGSAFHRHGRGPGRGEARDQRDVAIEVLRRLSGVPKMADWLQRCALRPAANAARELQR
jgi:hypothetical protein